MSRLEEVEPSDLSDSEQLRKLLFDEWAHSCPVFGGDPELLGWLDKPPWCFSLFQLVCVAIQTWWVHDVERTPGMAAIAEYVAAYSGLHVGVMYRR